MSNSHTTELLIVVIPVHNRRLFTQKCLQCLEQQEFKHFKVVVVDDGSTDGTSSMIYDRFKDVTVLKGDGNLWWAGAANMGVEYALRLGSKYIMTLNDDTEFNTRFIGDLVTVADENPDSLIGCSAVDLDSDEWVYGGERMDWLKAKTVKLLDILPEKERCGLHEVTHFPGRGLVVPSKVYREIGSYANNLFPHGVADNDFTLRAARAGYKIYCTYDVKLLSHSGESFGLKLLKNRSVRNYWKHITHMKGGGNIKFFIHYTLRNCPPKYLPVYLPVGLLKRMLGYWIHAVKGRG